MCFKMSSYRRSDRRGRGNRTSNTPNRNSPQYMTHRSLPRPMTYSAEEAALEPRPRVWYDDNRIGLPAQRRHSTSELERQMINMNLMEGEARNRRSRRSRSNFSTTSPRNLIINYLPQAFCDRDLFGLFVPFGPIQSIKIMKEERSGYSYGFGFVNYYHDEHALNAIENLNGLHLGNKILKVSVARPPSDDIKDTNVFITNLPRSYTEHELVMLFGRFGDIVQKHVLRDKRTDLSRGSAFVRYDLREQASRAILEMNGYVPDGFTDPLRVKLAQDHGKQKAAYLAGFQDAWYTRHSHAQARPRDFM